MNKPKIKGLPVDVPAPPGGWRYIGTGSDVSVAAALDKLEGSWPRYLWYNKGCKHWQLGRGDGKSIWWPGVHYAVRVEDCHVSKCEVDEETGCPDRLAEETGCTPAEIRAAVYAETLRCIKVVVSDLSLTHTDRTIAVNNILNEVDV